MKKIKGQFYNQHIISVDQFDTEDIDIIFQVAEQYKRGIESGMVYEDLKGKLLTALFYEPSNLSEWMTNVSSPFPNPSAQARY